MAGDICERDEEGNYRVVERSKDLIKYKGKFCSPKAAGPTRKLMKITSASQASRLRLQSERSRFHLSFRHCL